jgi:CheY-like chemotaxis protein
LPSSNRDVPQKVLVVDDDADWRQFLKLCLEDLGYEAIEASDGPEALQTIEQEDYAVMLLDLHMPGMSGEDVLQHLPRRHPKVVFLTSAPVHEVGRALQQGAHYYLPKGASREQLSLMLQSLHLS